MLTLTRKSSSIAQQRLLPGTPKALIYTTNIEQETQGATGALQATLFSHPQLLAAADYFGPFFLVGQADDIPGLAEFERLSQLSAPELLPFLPGSIDESIPKYQITSTEIGDYRTKIEDRRPQRLLLYRGAGYGSVVDGRSGFNHSFSTQEEHQPVAPGLEVLDPVAVEKKFQPKPAVHFTPEKALEKSPNQELDENENYTVVDTEYVSAFSVPRSAYGLVAWAKMPPIYDRNGDLPKTIVVQFLGVTWANQHLATPKHVFFTFQFYRFPEVTTEKLLAVPTNPGRPCILKRLRPGNGEPVEENHGFMVRLTVDRSAISPQDPAEFVNFLLNASLQIDVWDADSVQLIGTTDIPLHCLIRNGLEAVQFFAYGTVVQNIVGPLQKNAGSLFMKFASIGHPSNNQIDLVHSKNEAVVSKRLEKLDSAADSLMIRVRPLNPAHENALQKFLYAQRLDISQRFAEENGDSNGYGHPTTEALSERSKKTMKNFVFDAELEAYKRIRNEGKAGRLLNTLFRGITTEHKIHVSLGESVFFEFLLQNTLDQPVNCVVEIEEPGLRLLTDDAEWAFYKKAHKLDTPIERNLVRRDEEGKTSLVLKPREVVYVPFLYEDLKAVGKAEGQTSQTKVVFKRWPSLEPLQILSLHVVHQPYALLRSVRFYSREHHNCTRSIRVPRNYRQILPKSVKTSDPTVKARLIWANGALDLQFTAFCGPSGTSREFLLILYADAEAYRLFGVWKITLYSTGSIELKGIQSEVTNFGVELKKPGLAGRFIQIYSSNPELSPVGAQPTLFEDTDHRFNLQYMPTIKGPQTSLITAVDVANRDLCGSWLINTKSIEPEVTKEFEVVLRRGEEQPIYRKIPFQNPYGVAAAFRIRANRPDAIKVQEELLKLPPNGIATLTLEFCRRDVYTALIYIQNVDTAQTEETFRLNVRPEK
ncbi:unnamed protein product, partial [Mesorhabditis spiculigera]